MIQKLNKLSLAILCPLRDGRLRRSPPPPRWPSPNFHRHERQSPSSSTSAKGLAEMVAAELQASERHSSS